MSRRIPERYLLIVAKTDKEPVVLSLPAIALWIPLASLITLVSLSFLLGWTFGNSFPKKATLNSLFINS
jgi:hypothetical protein